MYYIAKYIYVNSVGWRENIGFNKSEKHRNGIPVCSEPSHEYVIGYTNFCQPKA